NDATNLGGALFDPTSVSDCVFFQNSAKFGGAIYVDDAAATIETSTFVGNDAARDGGGVHVARSAIAVRDTILWANQDSGGSDESAQLHVASAGSATIDFCCVTGLTGALGGTGNFADDPRLVDAASGDVHLLGDSPCIDAGDPAFV